jgi:hypothetical protein
VQNPSVYISGRLASYVRTISKSISATVVLTRVNEISSGQSSRSRRCLWKCLTVQSLKHRFETLRVEERISLDQLAQLVEDASGDVGDAVVAEQSELAST